MGKIFVIGLDGATFDIINPLIAKGELPNLAKLIREGIHGKLGSTNPPLSPAAWTSFMTGKNPGKHGILDFFGRGDDNYKVKFYNAAHRKGKPIWTLFSEAGKKVGVINVPLTYPPDTVNGFMISGMDTPGYKSDFGYPPEILSDLEKSIGGYQIEEVGRRALLDESAASKYAKEIDNLTENRYKSTTYLMNKYDWDLFVLVFEATDRAQHFFWKYMDQNHPEYISNKKNPLKDFIYTTYNRVDHMVGEIINVLDDDTTVIVMSDHGFGPVYRSFRLNLWLSQKGYLSFREGFAARKQLKRQKSFKSILPSRARKFLRMFTVFKKNPKEYVGMELFPNVDWSRTKAYAIGGFGNICLNLRGREPLGTVEPGREYEDLRIELIEELKGIKDPQNGREIIKEVNRREDVYSGEFLERAPDVLINWSKGYSYIGEQEQVFLGTEGDHDELFSRHSWSGNHLSEGILVIKGKNIRKNHYIKDSIIMDVAPTILYLSGIEIPDDMDGKILTDAIIDEFLKNHPLTYKESIHSELQEEDKQDYTEEESEIVKDRLRRLGYLR